MALAPPSAAQRTERAAARHYDWLRGRLARTRHYLRAVICVESLVHAAIALLVVTPTIFLLDNWLHFTTTLRLTSGLVIVGLTLAAFLATLRIAFQQWSDERIAMTIEARYPELENRLINAIQLGALHPSSPTSPLVASLIEEATRETSTHRLRKAVNTKGLKKALKTGIVLATLTGLYAILLPDHFANAAWRILLPNRDDLLPITRVLLEIQPGDTTIDKGNNLTIAALPKGGETPRDIRLQVRDARVRSQFRMEADGDRFLYELTAVTEKFRYRIQADDFSSRWYDVRVVERPRVERMAVRYEYPAYTNMAPAVIDPFNGSVVALTGSRATLMAWPNKPLRSAEIALGSGLVIQAAQRHGENENDTEATIHYEAPVPIERNDTYQWRIEDAQHFDNSPAQKHAIEATNDTPPRVAITSPRETAEVPQGETLNILYSASDDYGVASLEVRLLRDGKTSTLHQLQQKEPRKTLHDGYVLKTDNYQAGETLQITITVTDTKPGRPQTTISEPLTIRVIHPRGSAAARNTKSGENLLTALQRLLETQKSIKGDTEKWRVTLRGQNVSDAQRETILDKIVLDQSSLRVDALDVAGDAPDAQEEKDAWSDLRSSLRSLADAQMRQAARALEALKTITPTDERRAQTDAAHALQNEIIDRLEALIGQLNQTLAALEETPPPDEEEEFDEEDQRPPPSTLSDLHGAALDFLDDKNGLVKTLQELENISPEDLATSLPQQLDDLSEQDEEWSEYFKDASDWLRESAMVESTESGLRDELIEIFSEIHLLPEELRHEKVTIEVSAENAGAELAEELTTELEKWLAEEPDYKKWVMENAPEDYEVPLADLPDELTDMIGDLIESEEDMTEEIEDMTSNWADSLDKGAGWEAGDGPISNYSAKGVTGNVQPNDMDISGRSGEGRTGRSLGEIVESIATGKGGRDTQTRMTEDAMGSGRVEDLSTEQTGGVTGGGKIAGTSGYGLASPTAPEQPDIVQSLVQKQADIRQKAIVLQDKLLRMRLPGAHLDNSIRSMRQVEKSLQEGRYDSLRDYGAVVMTDLKNQREITTEHFKLRRDPDTRKRDKIKHNARQGDREEFPDEYRSLLSAYYEALSQENMD